MRHKKLKRKLLFYCLLFTALIGLLVLSTYLVRISQNFQYCRNESECKLWGGTVFPFTLTFILVTANAIFFGIKHKSRAIFLCLSILLYLFFILFIPPGIITNSNYLKVGSDSIRWDDIHKIFLVHKFNAAPYCTNELYAELSDGKRIYIGGQSFLIYSVDQGKGKLLDFLATNKNIPVENEWLNRSPVKDPYYDAKNRCNELYYYPGKEVFGS